MVEKVGPRISFLEARFEIAEIEASRVKFRADLGPGERSGNGRVGLASNRIGTHDRLKRTIAERVQVDASAALRNAVLRSHLPRVCAGEPTLEEVLSDPIVLRLMKADGINMLRLCEIMVKATLALTTPSRAVLAACAGT